MPKQELLLITGIPGTGKTCYGNKFASEFSFTHYDLEDPEILTQFVSKRLSLNKSVVATWDLIPKTHNRSS